ncbi:TIGR03915 family putative DNA repair protein [Clostridium psychrophilum]|uniref:TIGR03915 family putative DNA repair protein n=1 Tax=Clostridium psychrophilum TaxID=132926 RepID=UPI001C0BCD96|nr:TIGR03915 family putative DNA repair protein [Clostridium psychrophilum]MBU3181642.1 TIGR03915 family putative DNA repair protein [Clostridium psychrophilum]
MLRYIYDGTFDGFLTVIYNCYYNNIPESIEKENSFTFNILFEDNFIISDNVQSNKVSRAILDKISKEALINVYQSFLSEKPGIEMKLFTYIQLGFRIGSKINDYLTDETVNQIQKYSRKVGREAHKFLGLVRFQEFRGILYAAIEPTYNILELIGNHFKARLTNEMWIIHDIKRKIGIVYKDDEWILRNLEFKKVVSCEEEELFYQNLWKVFHKSVSIKERINEKLQMKNMPKKYWNNLIEMK